MAKTASQYRDDAEKVRQIAAEITDTEAKAKLFDVADEYERLAEREDAFWPTDGDGLAAASDAPPSNTRHVPPVQSGRPYKRR